MSNYTTKAQLIGGGDIVYVDRAFVRSYAEVQAEYPDAILNTTLAFRFTNSATLETLLRSVIIDSTSIVDILRDISDVREVEGDTQSPKLLDAKIDDSRILITLVHDRFDTIEILAVPESDAADAINHLHFHPTPHPAGISRVGQVRMGISNKRNRALNSGAFLVRGEDRTSTGINRVLAKVADNQDIFDTRTRNSFRGDTKRLLMCNVSNGVVSHVSATLFGGEILSTSSIEFEDSLAIAHLPDMQRAQYLFTRAENASQTLENYRANYDFIIGEESREDSYIFNITSGRVSASQRFEYSFIALSESARDIAIAALRDPSNITYTNQEAIEDENYWGSADRLGTIYGPRYRTSDDNKDPIPAEVVDFFTLRFDERVGSLAHVNVGDPVIIHKGVFEVDFVGDDNKTLGVRPFSGDLGELFSIDTETVSLLQQTAFPTSLVPEDRINKVIIVKSSIGKVNEFYGVGLRGYDHTYDLDARYFRIRCLMKSTDSTATDDLGFRSFIRTMQEAVDPYTSSTQSVTANSSLRSLNAVGGFLKLPKPYSIPEDVKELHRLDYMTGSSSYGPLRVSPGRYAAVPDHLSIFNGIGGYYQSPSADALEKVRHQYNLSVAIKSSYEALSSFLQNVDTALIHGNEKSAQALQRTLTSLSSYPLLEDTLNSVLHRVSSDRREEVLNFLGDLLQVTGRSLVHNDAPITMDASNGLTIKLSNEENYFSEEDVGRTFVIKLPIINKKLNQDIPYQTMYGISAVSHEREIRAYMHTWTSPRSARFVPVDEMNFYLPREVSATLSTTVGYANVGYGAMRNVVVSSEHAVYDSKPYPVSELKESTQYRHIYPGSETYLDIATPFTTSLQMYSTINYLLGSSEQLGDQTIDVFGPDKSLFLHSEAYVTFVGDISEAHTQDGNYQLNHSNRAKVATLDKFTFLPFLRSSDQRLSIQSDDLLALSLTSQLAESDLRRAFYNDLVSFSPNTYRDDIVSSQPGALNAIQFALFGLMNKIRGVDLSNEYTDLPSDGSDFTTSILPEWVRFIEHGSGEQSTNYSTHDELILDLYAYYTKPLTVQRASSGIRQEDAFVLKDVHAKTQDVDQPYPLNCEDLLSVDVSLSTASVGHAHELSDTSNHRSPYITSNRVLYIAPDTQYSSGEEPTSLLALINNIYGPNPTHVGELRQYVGQETVSGTFDFPLGIFRTQQSVDGKYVLNAYEVVPELPPGTIPSDSTQIPLRKRSWFRLRSWEQDNTPAQTFYFTFDSRGRIRELEEYASSGDAVSHIYGDYLTGSAVTEPEWQGVKWEATGVGRADITRVVSETNGDIIFALHSTLKSHDIPYYLTARVRNVAKLAPVSKELGKTLSVAITDQSGRNEQQLQSDFESPFVANSVIVSNAYPSTVQVRAGRVETKTYDNFSGSGMDIKVYDGEHGLVEGREDGVKITSLTRGYTDGLSSGDLHLRKKTALRVDSEETVFGVKVVHNGIETTMTEGAAAPILNPENRVFGHLAFAGLLVEAKGTAWSVGGKTASSNPTSLISPFSVTRDLRTSSSGIPLLSAEKIVVSGDAVGLYVPWDNSELGSDDESSRLNEESNPNVTATYNLRRGFRNASVVVEGDVDFPVELDKPEYDVDRAALAAFGRVSVLGLLDVYGDLYTTRFHHDNLGSNRITAGAVSHFNPTTAPRAQNTLYAQQVMNNVYVHISCPLPGSHEDLANYRQIQNLVEPPNNEFNRLLFPEKSNIDTTSVQTDSNSVPRDSYSRFNRNAMGISQQQLGERTTVLRIQGQVDPRLPTRYATENDIFFTNPEHVPVLPTQVKIASPDIGFRYPDYTLLGAAYHAQVDINAGHAPYGLDGEYLLLMFSRPIAMWGDSYLGRTVVFNLGTTDTILGAPRRALNTGWVSGVITKIVDSEDAGLTFVSIAPITSRFDRWVEFSVVDPATGDSSVLYTYPESFEDVIEPLLADNVIAQVPNALEAEDIQLWPDWYINNTHIGFRPTNSVLNSSDVYTFTFDIRVQGREWVANTSQVFVSDKLFVCNDIGTHAEVKLYRDGHLAINSPGDVTITGDTITIDASERINLDNEDGIYQNGRPLISATEVTANGYITIAAPRIDPTGLSLEIPAGAPALPDNFPTPVFGVITHDPFVDNVHGNKHPFYLRGMPVDITDAFPPDPETDDPAVIREYVTEFIPNQLKSWHRFEIFDATDVVDWFFNNNVPYNWSREGASLYPTELTQPLTPEGQIRLAFIGQPLETDNRYEDLIISCEGWHDSNELLEDGNYWRSTQVDEYMAIVYYFDASQATGNLVQPLKVYGIITDATTDPEDVYAYMTTYDQNAQHFVSSLGMSGKEPSTVIPKFKVYASLYGVSVSNDIKSQFQSAGYDINYRTQNESGDPYINDWRQFLHYDWEEAVRLYNREYSSYTPSLPSYLDNKLGPNVKEEDIHWVFTYTQYLEQIDNESYIQRQMRRYRPTCALVKDSWTYLGRVVPSPVIDTPYALGASREALISVIDQAINNIRVSSDVGEWVNGTSRISLDRTFRYEVEGQQYEVVGIDIISSHVDRTPGKAHLDPVGNAINTTHMQYRDTVGYPQSTIVDAIGADLNPYLQPFSGRLINTARWFDVGRAHTMCMLDFLLSADGDSDSPLAYRHMIGSPLWGILNPYVLDIFPTPYNDTDRANKDLIVDMIPAIVGVHSNITNYYDTLDENLSYGVRGADEYNVMYQSTNVQPSILGKYMEPPLLRRYLPDQVDFDTHSISRYGSAAMYSYGAYSVVKEPMDGFEEPSTEEYYVRRRTTDNVGTNLHVVSGKYSYLNKSDYPLWVGHTYNLWRTGIEVSLIRFIEKRTSTIVPDGDVYGLDKYPASYNISAYEEVMTDFISERYKLNSAMSPVRGATGLNNYGVGQYVQCAKSWLTGKDVPATYLSKDESITKDVAELRFRLNRDNFTAWQDDLMSETEIHSIDNPIIGTPYKTSYPELAPDEPNWAAIRYGAFLGNKPIVVPITVKLKIRIL